MLAVWFGLDLLVRNPLLVPSPVMVGGSLMRLSASGELADHVLASLSRLLVGLLIGVPLGALLGCAMGYWWRADAALNPFVRLFNSIPAIAMVPFSLLWFGVTEASRYSLLVYTISLTVLLAARHGVRSVPKVRMRAAATLGLGPVATLLRVVLPSCFPAILAGTRTAIGLGVMVIVAAEMLGAEEGLGFLIMQARSQFNIGNLYVGIIGLGLLSVALDRLFQATIDHLLPRWSVRRRIR